MDAVPVGAASIRFLGPGLGGCDWPHRRGLDRLDDLAALGARGDHAGAVLVAACLSTLLILVSCSHQSAAHHSTLPPIGPTPPPIGPTPTISRYQQISLPLDSYTATPSQQAVLYRISNAAENACLSDDGLSPVELPGTLDAFLQEGARTILVRSQIWGFYDTDKYQTYGYMPPPSIPSIIVFPNATGPADIVATCKTAGQDAVGSASAASSGSLPDGGPPIPIDDPRYQSVVRAWSKCMSSNGFDFSDPFSAMNNAAASPPDHARSIAMAQSDITCKNRTNLVGVAVAVDSAYQSTYIAAHLTQLDAYIQAVTTAIARAGH